MKIFFQKSSVPKGPTLRRLGAKLEASLETS